MASKSINGVVETLRRRHAAEAAALSAVGAASEALERVQERRAAELARWDARVGESQSEHDVAVAVLASLLNVDAVAQLYGWPVAQVRQAVQRAPSDVVAQRAGELVEGTPEPRVRRRRSAAVGHDGTGAGAGVGYVMGRLGTVERSAGGEVRADDQADDGKRGGGKAD